MECLRRLPLCLALLGVASCGREPPAPPAAPALPEVTPAPAPALPPLDPQAVARARAEAERTRVQAERTRAEAEVAAREEAERAAFEAAYPRHGVVFHFVAQVFAAPSDRGRAIGYMRRGAQFRAKTAVRGPGCPDGWHEVPGGGFVCDGNGTLIGEEPQHFEPSPVPPALDDALPYLYAYTMRDDLPQYWELPTLEQEAEAASLFAALRRAEAARAAAAEAAARAPAPRSLPADAGAQAEAEPAAPEDESPAGVAPVEAPSPPGQREEEGTPESDGPADEDGVQLPEPLRMRMLRGFYVSLDQREQAESGRRFYRTVRGAYVRESELVANEPPESRGVVLGGDWSLPVAIVFRTGAHRYERSPGNGRIRERGEIERHTPLALTAGDLVHEGRRYVVGRNGTLVREPSVRVIRQVARPGGVPTGAKWIHVDLSQQSLVAYEGDEPVFATLASTGKEGFETPTGLYRIQSKHVSTTMDDDTNPEGAYSIEDVPWTMYFHGNYALHGAFWHYTFGRVRSHGCVNLSPVDARWLFQWSTPTLPAAWHGVFAGVRERSGTYVFIEE